MGSVSTLDLPSTVSVLGRTFNVVIKEIPVTDPTNFTYGETEVRHNVIVIDPRQTQESAMETLYHEIVHTMLEVSGLGYLLSADKNELFAQTLGLCIQSLKIGSTK